MGLRICLVTPFSWSQPHDVNDHVRPQPARSSRWGTRSASSPRRTARRELAAGRRALRRLGAARGATRGTGRPRTRCPGLTREPDRRPVGVQREPPARTARRGRSTSSTDTSQASRASRTWRSVTPWASRSRRSTRPRARIPAREDPAREAPRADRRAHRDRRGDTERGDGAIPRRIPAAAARNRHELFRPSERAAALCSSGIPTTGRWHGQRFGSPRVDGIGITVLGAAAHGPPVHPPALRGANRGRDRARRARPR